MSPQTGRRSLVGLRTPGRSVSSGGEYITDCLACRRLTSLPKLTLPVSVRWHQTLRLTFTSHATQILNFAGLPSRGSVGRYLCLALTFAASGTLHWIADRLLGVPWRDSGALLFFVLQAAIITLEDALQRLLAWVPLGHGSRRAVGRLWLAVVLVLTTPLWMDPTARYVREGIDIMIPFRVLLPTIII